MNTQNNYALYIYDAAINEDYKCTELHISVKEIITTKKRKRKKREWAESLPVVIQLPQKSVGLLLGLFFSSLLLITYFKNIISYYQKIYMTLQFAKTLSVLS